MDTAPKPDSVLVDAVRKLHSPVKTRYTPIACSCTEDHHDEDTEWPCETAEIVYTEFERGLPLWLDAEQMWLKQEAKFVAEAKRRGLL